MPWDVFLRIHEENFYIYTNCLLSISQWAEILFKHGLRKMFYSNSDIILTEQSPSIQVNDVGG